MGLIGGNLLRDDLPASGVLPKATRDPVASMYLHLHLAAPLSGQRPVDILPPSVDADELLACMAHLDWCRSGVGFSNPNSWKAQHAWISARLRYGHELCR